MCESTVIVVVDVEVVVVFVVMDVEVVVVDVVVVNWMLWTF